MKIMKRRFNMIKLIIPGTIANYVAVWILTYLNLGHIWVLSSVIIGDIIGVEINTHVFGKRLD